MLCNCIVLILVSSPPKPNILFPENQLLPISMLKQSHNNYNTKWKIKIWHMPKWLSSSTEILEYSQNRWKDGRDWGGVRCSSTMEIVEICPKCQLLEMKNSNEQNDKLHYSKDSEKTDFKNIKQKQKAFTLQHHHPKPSRHLFSRGTSFVIFSLIYISCV